MQFTIRFKAKRRHGRGGAKSHFNYLWQDPIVQVIIVIIKNSVISSGGERHCPRSQLWDAEQAECSDNETQLPTSPLQLCPKVILLDVLEPQEEDSELRKRKPKTTLLGDTDDQVTLACKACEPLDVPEETRGPGRSQELRLALGLGSP